MECIIFIPKTTTRAMTLNLVTDSIHNINSCNLCAFININSSQLFFTQNMVVKVIKFRIRHSIFLQKELEKWKKEQKQIKKPHQYWEKRKKRMSSGANGRTVLEVGADGVAIITITNPPVNSLSFDGILFFFFISCFLS